jgi:YbbR domain-containing protein
MMDSYPRLKSLLFDNGKLKLLAVLLAILSFYAIRGTMGFEVGYDVPVTIEVEKGIAVLDQDVRTVEVTFRGSQEDLRRLNHGNIKAVVRPTEQGSAGSAQISIDPRDIAGAAGVRVVKIQPAGVRVTFDREIEKTVQVNTPKTVGAPLVGQASISYEPRFVTIRGPRRRLQNTHSVSTEPVDVDGRVQSFSKTVRVLSPADQWVSQIEPSDISVKVAIVTDSISREWARVPVLAAIPPGKELRVHFDPDSVKITLAGRPELVNRVEADSVKAFIDCSGLDTSATYELPVSVRYPCGADTSAKVEPETVTVFFDGT